MLHTLPKVCGHVLFYCGNIAIEMSVVYGKKSVYPVQMMVFLLKLE